MLERLKLLILLVLIYYTSNTRPAAVPSSTNKGLEIDDASKMPILQPKVSNYILEVDLSSCICTHDEEDCQVIISRSTVLNMNCPSGDVYCCNGQTKLNPLTPQTSVITDGPISLVNDKESSDKNNLTTPSEDSVAVKDELLTDDPSEIDTEEYSEEQLTEDDDEVRTLENMPIGLEENLAKLAKITSVSSDVSNSKKRCECKPRGECLEKNIDYGFGFHCSYDTIRCCELENEILKQILQESGRSSSTIEATPSLGLKDNNGTLYHLDSSPFLEEDEDDIIDVDKYNGFDKCYCLPPKECSNGHVQNVNWRRQDTLCPRELVQCCGGSTDFLQDKFDEGTQQSENDNNNTNSFGTNEGDNLTNDPLYGQGGFRHPITLPELKIPMTEHPEEDGRVHAEEVSPPPLPTYYNYQPPKYYSGYYHPGNAEYEMSQKLQPTSGHSGVHYIPGNHRVSYPPVIPIDQSRNYDSSPSLLEKLSKILG